MCSQIFQSNELWQKRPSAEYIWELFFFVTSLVCTGVLMQTDLRRITCVKEPDREEIREKVFFLLVSSSFLQ